MWLVYILKSNHNKWYYIGSTNNIERRLKEHNFGKVQSTKSKRPLVLVYKKAFDTESQAREYEKRLKDRRIEKEELIRKIENCGIV